MSKREVIASLSFRGVGSKGADVVFIPSQNGILAIASDSSSRHGGEEEYFEDPKGFVDNHESSVDYLSWGEIAEMAKFMKSLPEPFVEETEAQKTARHARTTVQLLRTGKVNTKAVSALLERCANLLEGKNP